MLYLFYCKYKHTVSGQVLVNWLLQCVRFVHQDCMININEDQEKEITAGMWQLLVEKDLLISSMFQVLQKIVITILFKVFFTMFFFVISLRL